MPHVETLYIVLGTVTSIGLICGSLWRALRGMIRMVAAVENNTTETVVLAGEFGEFRKIATEITARIDRDLAVLTQRVTLLEAKAQ